jgi:16S rRNA (cytosine967-C5)-methyltransferase
VDLLRCALPAPHPDRVSGVRKPFRWRAILEGLAAARRDPAWAGPALSGWFRGQDRLGARDRKVVQDAIFGIIRQEALFARAGATDDAAHLELWCAALDGDRLPGLASEGPEADYAVALGLPRAVAEEWLRALGPAGAAAFGAAQAVRAPAVVRANRARCSPEALAERLLAEGVSTTPHPLAADALEVDGRANLVGLPAFREGWFEVQDPSSQAFCAALPLRPGDEVMDLCAGAGGKALALAARGARVRAWDLRRAALHELEKRSARAGAGVRVGPPAPADLVVVDAPCSGTGRLRREPTLRWGFDPGKHLGAQAALVQQGAALVRPGGHLAYATCSLLAAENAPPPPGPGFVEVQRRLLWPHVDHCDGFGWVVWAREG